MEPVAVIFDNDGVVVDSEQISLEAYIRAIEEQGLKLCQQDEERNCGLTDADIIADLTAVYGASLDLARFSARKKTLYRELAEHSEMRVFPGVHELIADLRREQIPYALASSGSSSKIRYNFARAGIEGLFSVVVSGEQFERGKPDPEIFLCAADKLGVIPSRCAIIEDSINGLKAAGAAGAFAIGVTNTFARAKLGLFADTVVDSLLELSASGIRALLDGRQGG